MIKVVADTNVYISAILFGGKAEEIRKLAREGKIELLISETIMLAVISLNLSAISLPLPEVHRDGLQKD